MIKLHKGKTKLIYLPKKASTVFAADSIVAAGTTSDAGLVIPATSSHEAVELIGVIRREVKATDSDYASQTRVAVEVPVSRVTEWLATTANAVAADVNKEVDLTDASTVNRGASSTKVARVRRVLSPTRVAVTLKLEAAY